MIYFDMDGVLADLYGAVLSLLGHKEWPTGKPSIKDAFGEEKDIEVWSKIDRDFWINLKPTIYYPTLLALMLKLQRQRKPISILSHLPGFHGLTHHNSPAASGKLVWAQAKLPPIPLILTDVCKSHFCHPGDWLIDDSRNNINAFIEAGGRGVLIPTPQNNESGSLEPLKELLCINV